MNPKQGRVQRLLYTAWPDNFTRTTMASPQCVYLISLSKPLAVRVSALEAAVHLHQHGTPMLQVVRSCVTCVSCLEIVVPQMNVTRVAEDDQPR